MCMKNIILIFLIFLALFSVSYAAVSLPYWYSDENAYYRCANQPIAWYTHYDNLFTTSQFAQSIQHAKNEWTDNGVSVNLTTDITSSNVKIHGGSWSRMKVINSQLSPQAMGNVEYTSYMQSEIVYHAGDMIIGNKSYNARMVIVYNETFAEEPDNLYYKNIATHEMGHALGWYGHSDAAGNVMNNSVSKFLTQVGNEDALHLTQIYDLYPY